MLLPVNIEPLVENLPDADGARRFYRQFAEKFPAQAKKLSKNEGLFSDVLTLAAFSPLLSTTLLQNPDYVSWLERQRKSAKVRGKEELLEALARFALTNSNVDTNILLARFRRRELVRIYLQDIRRLETVAEITEEISNLADAILEYALRQARQTLDNRYGAPLETDAKGRATTARFCIVALGKLGSKELNYASDIDLLFLYSKSGATTGQGERGEAITNREYFVKLAETLLSVIGAQAGEGAAYRVDLRLRPNGRVGAPAISLSEAVDYYKTKARAWERQVLIRSRSCAGDAKIFQSFFEAVKSSVFSKAETIADALENVRLSKEKINAEKFSRSGFNVKLGRGGIREIEFIAQALQLAYGGRDEWLQRAPHTLISLARLADRKLIGKNDLTELFDAYDFLRTLEHRLQMENGLQTHVVPEAPDRILLAARRMNFQMPEDFNTALKIHTNNVNRIFERVFRRAGEKKTNEQKDVSTLFQTNAQRENAPEVQTSGAFEPFKQTENSVEQIVSSLEKSTVDFDRKNLHAFERLMKIAPFFAERVAASPVLINDLPTDEQTFARKNYSEILLAALRTAEDFRNELAILRKTWTALLLEIVAFDAFEKIALPESKRAQTLLAEASIEAALVVTRRELERRFQIEITDLPFAVLGLGKLGGGGMDYNSDLDLILVYDKNKNKGGTTKDEKNAVSNSSVRRPPSSFSFARAAEIFTTVLSSLTRDGNLYRVDLRLRPDGKNGALVSEKTAFLNYLSERAAVWEWLAYVKIRAVAGEARFAEAIEGEAKKIIYQKALETDVAELKSETRRVRERLEQEKSSVKKSGGAVDIKFGAGGMLDVYFAVRFLQLRDNVPDDAANRSTARTLERLRENNSLSREDFANFSNGYEFLNRLDHNLRLVVGRSTRVPIGSQNALRIITERMKLASAHQLLENLTVHRLNIRASFERILEGGR